MTYKKIWHVHKNGTITDLSNIKEQFKKIAERLIDECDWKNSIIVVGDHEWNPQNAHFFYFENDFSKILGNLMDPVEVFFGYPVEKLIKAIDGIKITSFSNNKE